jgi:glucosamine--fructose-6-phosphate aminotransferase (isomerizing)
MNLKNSKYKKFALVREMLETSDVVKNFDPACATRFAKDVKAAGRLFLTGEGSSRIFPAKHAITRAEEWGMALPMSTQGGRQAIECDLKKFAVFGASNSGKTLELITLFKKLKQQKHKYLFGLTATPDSMLEHVSKDAHVLSCGKENAVAATKSVVEQALFYHAMISKIAGKPTGKPELGKAANAIKKALELDIPKNISSKIAKASRVYFAGRNDGVAEELTLKTNEIIRKPSAFLEGTYAVHGIEEVMEKTDVVIVVDPFEKEIAKFRECLEKGVGLSVIAISSKKLPVPTIKIPSVKNFDPYIQLAAGWNLLVEAGLLNGIDLDTPVRARKIGNEAPGK